MGCPSLFLPSFNMLKILILAYNGAKLSNTSLLYKEMVIISCNLFHTTAKFKIKLNYRNSGTIYTHHKDFSSSFPNSCLNYH